MSSYIKENQLAVLGFSLAAGLVIAALVLTMGIDRFKSYSSEQITVTGAASKSIESDSATWSGTVTSRGDTMQAAYGPLKSDVKKVHDYLIAQNVPETAISLASISTQTLYQTVNSSQTNTVEGFVLSQTINVTSDDVNLIDTVSKSADSLIAQGLTFTSNAPQFYYNKLDSLKVTMLSEAMKNARDRAKSMANSTGNSIGLMRSAQMGVFQITSPTSTEVSDYGINDTSSKSKKVTAVVNATFAVR